MKIQKTTNYDLFSNNPHQRTFKPRKVKELIEKMKRNGFPPSMAISVYVHPKRNGEFIINAGHHRLAAAKALGIPVLYVVEHKWSVNELSDEGMFVTSWSIKDHVANYAKDGHADYLELLKLQGMGLNISQASSMLIGEQAGSGNATDQIKAGTFKIKTRDHVNLWIELKKEFGEKVPCVFHRVFIAVWSKCLFTPEFDNDVFMKRVRANPSMLEKCNTEDQMLRMIEDIYNFKSSKKIPLSFLVTNNSASRKIMGSSKKKSDKAA